jgi:hypothetical protein
LTSLIDVMQEMERPFGIRKLPTKNGSLPQEFSYLLFPARLLTNQSLTESHCLPVRRVRLGVANGATTGNQP